MIVTATDVQRVARTARPHPVRDGLDLDIEWIVKRTTMTDWDGALYELGATAAYQLANQFNVEHDLIINGRRPKPKLAKE